MKRIRHLVFVVSGAMLLAALPATVSEVRAAAPKKPASQKTHERIGNVVSVDSSHILIRTKKGEEFKFFVTAATIFGDKSQPKKPEEFKAGNIVRVIYGRGEGNQITAKQVIQVTHPSNPKKK
ncbi:MAG: hypothetical protein HZA91_12515 [Verrucomicrobia bacterium]|nr:hypothetical protein [Verrucomicrobiota bacterium]